MCPAHVLYLVFCVCVSFLICYLFILFYFLSVTHLHTHDRPVRLSMALPCLLSLTVTFSALSIPVDVPAVWDPSASLDPSATLPAEVAVQQVQIMASIVLALLAQPFSEYHF